MAKKTGSDKAKQAIKSGYQVKEEKPIRWLKRDNAKVAKAVKRANAKASRLNKKGFAINKISVKGIKENVRTREEFNKLLKDIDKFVERGSEKGKTREDIWNHEVDYYKMKHRTNEERKAKALEEFQNETVTSRGQPVGVRKTQTGKNKFMTDRESALSPSDFKVKNRRQFNSQNSMIDKHLNKRFNEAKAANYKESMLKAVEKNIGDPYIMKMMAMLDNKTFDYLSRTEIEMDIQFMYSLAEKAYKAQVLYDILDPYVSVAREKDMRTLKREGVPESTLEKIKNLDHYDYANNFVSDIKAWYDTDPLGNERTHLKYTILKDKGEIISKFGK